jgi:hypothetical protein
MRFEGVSLFARSPNAASVVDNLRPQLRPPRTDFILPLNVAIEMSGVRTHIVAQRNDLIVQAAHVLVTIEMHLDARRENPRFRTDKFHRWRQIAPQIAVDCRKIEPEGPAPIHMKSS